MPGVEDLEERSFFAVQRRAFHGMKMAIHT